MNIQLLQQTGGFTETNINSHAFDMMKNSLVPQAAAGNDGEIFLNIARGQEGITFKGRRVQRT